jgi:hypothetical protein
MISVQEFEITYKDGSYRSVTAAEYTLEGEWFIFHDDSGKVVDTNAAKDVRSIGKPTEVSFGIA